MDDSTNLDIGLERALAIAHRSLASRDRTVREVRAALERKGVSEVVIEETLDELARAGLVDDARFARRFAEDKRELERWGAARIERELERRGVPGEHVSAVLADRGVQDELHSALLLLEQRHPGAPADDRTRDRAWRLLVRRGYDPALAYDAVREHERRVA